MPMNASTLVLGAGELGRSVLRALARRRDEGVPMDLTVLLRRETVRSQEASKQQLMAELGSLDVRVAEGDLHKNSAEELAASFAAFGTVIGCAGFVAGTGVQRKITDAVLAAGVERYVPWQFGVDYDVIGRGSAQDLFDEQLEVREMLRAQGKTGWLIVSTGMFTSFLFEQSVGVVDLDRGIVRALRSWDNAVTVTTAEDIGELTAAILSLERPLTDQIVYTAGDTLTYERLANVVQTALGREVQRSLWSLEQLRRELAEEPGDALRKYRLVFAEGRGVAWPKESSFNGERGLPVTSVEQWLALYGERGGL